jgi:hypothetical protein
MIWFVGIPLIIFFGLIGSFLLFAPMDKLVHFGEHSFGRIFFHSFPDKDSKAYTVLKMFYRLLGLTALSFALFVLIFLAKG